MRNFVPALEESLMKFTPAEITREQPDAKYKARGGWFGVESLELNSDKNVNTYTKKSKAKRG